MRKRGTLTQTCVIAASASATIAVAFLLCPPCVAGDTVFDETAWKETVELLKAEVGPAADKGIFYIPDRPVDLPERMTVAVLWNLSGCVDVYQRSTSAAWLFLRPEGSSLLLIDRIVERAEGTDFFNCRLARLDDAAARRACAVLSRCVLVDYTGSHGYPVFVQRDLALDCWGPDDKPYAVGPTRRKPWEALPKLGASLASRYIRKLEQSGSLTFSSSAADVAPALLDVLNIDFDKCAFDALGRYPTTSVLPGLRTLRDRYIAAIPSSEPFSDEGEWADGCKAQIWIIENLLGKSDDEKIRAASAVLGDPNSDTMLRLAVCGYLADSSPAAASEIFAAHFPLFNRRCKRLMLLDYKRFFGDDPRPAISVCADAEAESGAAAWANFHRYRLTGDKSALESLLNIAVGRGRLGVDCNEYGILSFFNDTQTVDVISTYLRANWRRVRFNQAVRSDVLHNDPWILGYLANAGGEANADFLMRIVREPMTSWFRKLPYSAKNAISKVTGADIYEEYNEWPALAVRCIAAGNVPSLAPRLAAFLPRCGNAGLEREIIHALAEVGDASTLSVLQSFKPDTYNQEDLDNAVFALRMKTAPDVPAFVSANSATLLPSSAARGALASRLAESYTVENLQALLCDPRMADFLLDIYAAIVARREAGEE